MNIINKISNHESRQIKQDVTIISAASATAIATTAAIAVVITRVQCCIHSDAANIVVDIVFLVEEYDNTTRRCYPSWCRTQSWKKRPCQKGLLPKEDVGRLT